MEEPQTFPFCARFNSSQSVYVFIRVPDRRTSCASLCVACQHFIHGSENILDDLRHKKQDRAQAFRKQHGRRVRPTPCVHDLW